MKNMTKSLLVALVLTVPAAFAQGAKGGGADLIGPRPVKAASVKVQTMECPSCSTIKATVVTSGSKGRPGATIETTKHSCPGCKTTRSVEGHGKAKRDAAKHTCTIGETK